MLIYVPPPPIHPSSLKATGYELGVRGTKKSSLASNSIYIVYYEKLWTGFRKKKNTHTHMRIENIVKTR